MRRFIVLFLILNILLSISVLFVSGVSNKTPDLTIVFTHDLHSHIDPFPLNGESSGGFARIKSFIDDTKSSYSNTLVLDGGDFSMGTLFQTAFTTSAIEYRMLGALGYDATTFGNHEFDYGFDAVQQMINVAQSSGDSLPPILCANINSAQSGFTDKELSDMNISKYKIIKKDNYTIAVFGLLGRDAVELSSAGNLVFDDFIDSAKNTVSEIKKLYSPDVIICLSHSGTGDDVDDEDVQLAKEVEDIDVIISGHTHTYLAEPIIVNDTIIASCGEYGENVGRILLDIDNKNVSLISYSLTKVDSNIEEDTAIKSKIDGLKVDINSYLERFGYSSPNEIIAYSPYEFTEQSVMSDELSEQPLGNLISDSYIYAIKSTEGDSYVPVDVSVTPVGVVRASIDKGEITVSQVYEISSLGIGNDGVHGYPLCSVYLYGSELWALAEIDASVSGIMSYAQLYCSGLGYSVNTNRMFMNRVYDCWLIDENGNRVEIIKDKLYRVVSGITSAEMLGTVKDKSFGLLKLTPKDSKGDPISDFNKHIITDENGTEIKEWKALADYLSSFPEGGNGIPTIPAEYSTVQGRKNIISDFQLFQIFSNWNFITWTVAVLVFVLLLIFILIIVAIIKKRNKRKRAVALFTDINE